MNCPPEGFIIPAEFSEVIDQCLRKKETHAGGATCVSVDSRGTVRGNDCQSPAQS